MGETYRHQMFKGVLRGFIIKHKAIFMKAIIAYAKILPEPTRENTFLSNIHTLMDIRDEFKRRVNIPSREELLDAVFKIGISEYAHDTVYQFFADWLIEELRKSDWVIPNRWDNRFWKEKLGARTTKPH